MSKQKTIVLTGGGTLGSVSPLLAIAHDLRETYEFCFIGTENGVERDLVTQIPMSYHGIVGGKLRRYWSLMNLIDPLLIVYGFVESLLILRKLKPSLVISAGSYISVGVLYAAKLLGIKSMILQLDVVPGLANKLMSKVATKTAVTLPESRRDFKNSVLTGAPVSQYILALNQIEQSQSRQKFKLSSDKPVLLVLGGGTGSMAINKLITDNLYHLTQICQVLHIVGPAKKYHHESFNDYHCFQLLKREEMAEALNACDLVISRAGMGVLTELAYLTKPVVLIPMPESHQEFNAKYFADKSACIYLHQDKLNSWDLVNRIRVLICDDAELKKLGDNLHQALKLDGNQKLGALIKKMVLDEKSSHGKVVA